MYYYENRRKKSIYLWIVILILLITALNVPSVRNSRPLHFLGGIASNISFPFKYVFNGIFSNSTSGVREFFRLKGIQKESEKLKNELSGIRAQNILLSEMSRENEKLRSALSFRSKSYIPGLLPAEVISRNGSSWFSIVEINRGSADKVRPESAVINAEGLVGRVFAVSQFSSRVLLITDPSSAVSVLDSDTGDLGIAAGNSMGPIRVLYMSATAAVKAGDKIVTSGMSDIFPKGVVVGTVTSASKKDHDIFQKVNMSPSVNFSKLDKVFVIIK